MDELEKNIPDDFWRKAFDEAAETPPPRVWATIERRLEESQGPTILPLWGAGLASSRSFIWGSSIAAAVTLLLVGWWAVHPQSPSQSVAQRTQLDAASSLATTRIAPATPSISRKQMKEPGTSAGKPILASTQEIKGTVRKTLGSPISLPTSGAVARIDLDLKPSYNSRALQTRSVAMSTVSAPENQPATTGFTWSVSRVAVVSYGYVSIKATDELESNLATSFTQLEAKPLRLRKLGTIQRIVWSNPAWSGSTGSDQHSERLQKKQAPKDVWASASVMPGAFNPMVAVRSATPAFASALNSPADNQLSVSSRADFSVAYQAGAGIQLTEHWSVESGVGYLMGRSTVETPTQVSMASIQTTNVGQANLAANLYIDALRSSSHASLASSNVSTTSHDSFISNTTKQVYDSQSRQVLTNAYQYIQVPVQVGYQLRPRKRLSLALLGGLLTNIFVRNTVGDDLVVTSRDGVYRPVSWAATLGARFRYRPSRQWSASLAGIYQPSLGLGTQADSQVQSRPTSAGMSLGVDYHF